MASQKLIAPNGSEFVARTPREANDLIYGAGYRPAGTAQPDQAIRATADPEPPTPKRRPVPKVTAPTSSPDSPSVA